MKSELFDLKLFPPMPVKYDALWLAIVDYARSQHALDQLVAEAQEDGFYDPSAYQDWDP